MLYEEEEEECYNDNELWWFEKEITLTIVVVTFSYCLSNL